MRHGLGGSPGQDAVNAYSIALHCFPWEAAHLSTAVVKSRHGISVSASLAGHRVVDPSSTEKLSMRVSSSTSNKKHDAVVAVVGAGIIGAMTALHLQQLGKSVVLIDRAAPGWGCSYGNGGAISPDLCVPVALPGMLKRLPGWFRDPLGPLVVRWQTLPTALPWLIRKRWLIPCGVFS